MELTGKRVSILGLGKSGLALARVLHRLGAASMLISDAKAEDAAAASRDALAALPVEFEWGGHTDRVWRGRDMMFISPGVSIHHPVIAAAKAAGVPVYGEIELAYRLARGPIVAVTGTNGKSTTATLIHQMLVADGQSALLAGNIGNPVVGEVLDAAPGAWIVTEVSSFQLEAVSKFRARVAVVTNITSDHLDRHRTFEEYVQAKARLLATQRDGDVTVLNADDPAVANLAAVPRGDVRWFSRTGPVDAGADAVGGMLRWRGPEEEILPGAQLALQGPHNLENALAAAAAARACGVRPSAVRTVLRNARGLHHRMEVVGQVGGVACVDDSKATNPGAVIRALESAQAPVVLIAGGKDKAMDFTGLGRAIAAYAVHLVQIGETGPAIAAAAAAAGFSACTRAGDMRDAVRQGLSLAGGRGTLLLSPACASFDMFASAEDRGEQFAKAVREMEAALVEKRA